MKACLVLLTVGALAGTELSPLNISPTVDQGALAVFDWKDRVHVYRLDGTLIRSYTAQAAKSVAVNANGRVAVAAKAGVSLFDANGAMSTIDTTGFEPTNVCLGSDSSVWVMVRPSLDVRRASEDYPVVRHYSWDGQLIDTALRRFSLPAGRLEPSESVTGGVGCRAFGERVGFYLNYGGAGEGWWVELSLHGKELGRWRMPKVMFRGVSAAGIVYGRGWDGQSVLQLDRDRGVWMEYQTSARGNLIGVDGNELIFRAPGDPNVTKFPIQ